MASYPVEMEPKGHHQDAPGGYGEHSMAREMQGGGLEVLRNMDCVYIKQDCTCCPCWTFNSKYKVLDNNDQTLFDVLEDTSCPMRWFCGVFRAYEIRVTDPIGTEVMQFRRPIRCGQCYNCYGNFFFPCCLSEVEVCAPPTHVIGNIRQNFSLCNPSFSGLDANGQEQFHIRGSCLRFCYCVDLDFQILSNDGDNEIGKITKKWTNCCNEICTNAHKFKVEFPHNADVRTKALILAAAIQIDYQHYT